MQLLEGCVISYDTRQLSIFNALIIASYEIYTFPNQRPHPQPRKKVSQRQSPSPLQRANPPAREATRVRSAQKTL